MVTCIPVVYPNTSNKGGIFEPWLYSEKKSGSLTSAYSNLAHVMVSLLSEFGTPLV